MRYDATIAALILIAIPSAVVAENLVKNPSAEEAAANGMPKGWGLYVGAGGLRLTVTADEKHSGKSAACLELHKWYTPKDAKDTSANHSVSGAIVLAENSGYRAQGAIPCRPGTNYVFSFWYKGTVPAAHIGASGWPSAAADHDRRVSVPVTARPLQPSSNWQQCSGSIRSIPPRPLL